MKKFLFFVSLLFLAGCASHSIKISDSPPQIVYQVDVSNYTDDFFHVTVSTNDLTAKNNIYNFTATAPGAYQVMDFGRFVESFKAFDENGKELKSERLSTNRWQIENSEELAKVVYKIEDSYDADIDSNFIAPMSGTGIQESFIVCNTFGVLGYFEGLQSNPVKLKISYNPEWTIMNAIENAQSPYDASKVTIGELQLIRLVLDYASSTLEAITLIQQYNIRMEDPPIHYLIADSSGYSVIIELVNGRLEIIDNSNPWQVTTNFVITGSNAPQNAPCWRYRSAYQTLSNNNGVLSEGEAVSLLQDVSVSITRWSTVFNLNSGQLQIAMGCDYENFHHFNIH